MASVTIVFRKDKLNKKDEAPIHFRIIKNRRTSYISSGVMVHKDNWDERRNRIKGKHPHSGRINSLLTNKFSELQDQVLALETTSKLQTGRQLRNKVFGMKPVDFFEFADKCLERYKREGKIGTHDSFSSTIKKLRDYPASGKLCFHDITPEFLSKYEGYLRTKHSNSTNTIHKDLKFIRNVFNQAINQDVIEFDVSPFRKYKLKTEKTQRSFLSEEELKLIEEYECTVGTRIEMHRDMFVFAAYAGGLRISDILKLRWIDFDGTHIHCSIKKTGIQLSIKLPQRALSILDKYKPGKPNKKAFIFPLLPANLNLGNPVELDEEISKASAYVNKNLKIIAEKIGLEKKLSFHVSRHTFATMALRKGISIDKVSKLLAHAAIRETQIYAKVVNEELDKAMDVFN